MRKTPASPLSRIAASSLRRNPWRCSEPTSTQKMSRRPSVAVAPKKYSPPLHSVGQAPLAGKVDDALCADTVGIEDLEIDAARDRSQPVAADPIDTGGVVGD